jgi:hypothetical protein
MTLLLTEFHKIQEPEDAFIVFTADRRISQDGKAVANQVKVFRVPPLNAGIGFVGLSEVPNKSMTDWLKSFLAREVKGDESLGQFAGKLTDALNAVVPPTWHQSLARRSGFHIAGFTPEGRPEFWFIRNMDDDRQAMLKEFEPREDLQRWGVRQPGADRPGLVHVYRWRHPCAGEGDVAKA